MNCLYRTAIEKKVGKLMALRRRSAVSVEASHPDALPYLLSLGENR